MGTGMGKVLCQFLLVGLCASGCTAVRQVREISDPIFDDHEDTVTVVEVRPSLDGVAGMVGFGSVIVRDRSGRYSHSPTYLSDDLKTGETVEGNWIFVPKRMHHNALKLVR